MSTSSEIESVKAALAAGGYELILGSSSQFRRAVLTRLGFQFRCMSPDIDEKAIRDSDPAVMTVAIATAKAAEIQRRSYSLSRLPPVARRTEQLSDDDTRAIVICSDQVIVCNGQIREKPTDAHQATQFLSSYRTHPAEAIDGVVVFNTATGKSAKGVATATQSFSSTMPDAFIQQLITQGEIFNCAGGFVVAQMTEYTTTRVGELETIEGLPVELTLSLMKQVL